MNYIAENEQLAPENGGRAPWKLGDSYGSESIISRGSSRSVSGV